jgi:23S rRNA pseudouridine1911/1915/1917 synthase
MVFARSAELQEMFQKNWNNLVKEYTYTAVVGGRPEQKEGTVTSWLTENKNYVMMSSPSDNGGLKSVTHYKVIKSTGRYSLLDFDLETKRKNQLRIHMQAIGHPVVGDKKYGASNNPIKRIALHVRELVLKHPVTGEVLEFKSPIPKAMQQLVTVQPKREATAESDTEEQ